MKAFLLLQEDIAPRSQLLWVASGAKFSQQSLGHQCGMSLGAAIPAAQAVHASFRLGAQAGRPDTSSLDSFILSGLIGSTMQSLNPFPLPALPPIALHTPAIPGTPPKPTTLCASAMCAQRGPDAGRRVQTGLGFRVRVRVPAWSPQQPPIRGRLRSESLRRCCSSR